MKILQKIMLLIVITLTFGCGGGSNDGTENGSGGSTGGSSGSSGSSSDATSSETGTSHIKMSKNTYTSNDKISVIVSGELSGRKDWAGVYPKGSNNDWNNVIIWNWASAGTIPLDIINKGDGYLSAGEYEARLFFNNSYDDEAKVAFNVTESATNFAAYGTYEHENLTGEAVQGIRFSDIRVYKPKKNGEVRTNAPVVIVSTGGWGSSLGDGPAPRKGYERFIAYIVSKGYFVIGVSTQPEPEEEFARILTTINAYKNTGLINTARIGIMGSSTGGGMIFHHMKKLQDNNFASDKNFVISLDGSFAWGLTISELNALHTTSLLLQFGGVDGLDEDGQSNNNNEANSRHYQSPKVMMTIFENLPANDEKAFSYINNDFHSYIQGSMEGREDLLKVVGAMLAYKFENGGETAKNIALNNKYQVIKDAMQQDSQYNYGCKWNWLIDGVKYDYCDDNNLQPN